MNRSPTTAPEVGRETLAAIERRVTDGCREAARSLGRIARTPSVQVVDLSVRGRRAAGGGGAVVAPELNLQRFGTEIVAVGSSVDGLVVGRWLLAMRDPDARRLAGRLLGVPLRPGPLSPGARSALCEAGNIAGSAFLTAFGRQLPGVLLPSVPRLVEGQAHLVRAQLAAGAAAVVAEATLVVEGLEAGPLAIGVAFAIVGGSVDRL